MSRGAQHAERTVVQMRQTRVRAARAAPSFLAAAERFAYTSAWPNEFGPTFDNNTGNALTMTRTPTITVTAIAIAARAFGWDAFPGARISGHRPGMLLPPAR
jgi:hypothetical protein